MVAAAMEGFEQGAAEAGHPAPVTLGVTVLTSDGAAGQDVFDQRVAVARAVRLPRPGLLAAGRGPGPRLRTRAR